MGHSSVCAASRARAPFAAKTTPAFGAPLRRRSRHFCSVLISGLIIVACSQPAPPEPAPPRPVVVERIEAGLFAADRAFTGELRAADRADLSFESGGPITSIAVDLGDSFERGDILARVSDRTARLDLDARRAELADAQSARDEAQRDYDRRSGLAGTGAISNASIDQAKSVFDSAQARVRAISSQVASARERVSDTQLVAPFSGEVVERLAEPSQVVSAGQPVLSVIGSDAGLEAIVRVPETYLTRLDTRATAEITITSTGSSVSGTVIEIGARANSAGLFPITLSLDEAESGGLRPGQSVEVRLKASGPAGSGLVIPVSAFVQGPRGNSFAFVISESGDTVEQTEIVLGAPAQNGIEVISGLEPGDTIVVRGADLLTDGQEVDPLSSGIDRFND